MWKSATVSLLNLSFARMVSAPAMSVSPGVWLYQLTETGLALELTAKGTKYYKDDDLN